MTNVVLIDVSADGSDLFVNDDVASNETLQTQNKASTFTFLSSHKLAAVASSYL